MKWLALALLLLVSCTYIERAEQEFPAIVEQAQELPEAVEQVRESPVAREAVPVEQPPHYTIVAFGDSLTAGIDPETAYPMHLERMLQENGTNATVINMGRGGDTTADALARLDEVIAQNPDVVIVALGANDAAQLLEPEITRENLEEIITRLKAEDITVILAGSPVISIPQWDFPERFTSIYSDLAEKHDLIYAPFFLEGVIGDVMMNTNDRVHPNTAGNERIARNMVHFVQQALN